MTTFVAKSITNGVNTGEDSGALTHNRFIVNLNDLAVFPAPPGALNDLIQIGVVPAGEMLLPYLCLLQIPILDSGGAPTGQASVGTLASPAVLKAAGVVNAAQILSNQNFLIAAAVGDSKSDTPIYIKFTNVVQTGVVVGQIVFDQVCRPWNQSTDGADLS